MPDDAAATTSQVDNNAATSQVDNNAATSQVDSKSDDQVSYVSTDIKNLPQMWQDEIRHLRSETAKYRTKAQQLEDAGKTELQRITDERDRLKGEIDSRDTRLRAMAVTATLTDALSKAGAKHPSLMVSDLAGQADLDDDLNVKNTDKLVKAAKEQYPDLFRVVDGTADGGKGRQQSGNGTTDMNRLLRRSAGFAG